MLPSGHSSVVISICHDPRYLCSLCSDRPPGMWHRPWAPRSTMSPGQARWSLRGPPGTWSPSTSGQSHPRQIFNNMQGHQCDINIFVSHPVGGSPFVCWQEHSQMSWGDGMESLWGLREQWLWSWSLEESFRQKGNPEDWLAWGRRGQKVRDLHGRPEEGCRSRGRKGWRPRAKSPWAGGRELRLYATGHGSSREPTDRDLQLHTVQSPSLWVTGWLVEMQIRAIPDPKYKPAQEIGFLGDSDAYLCLRPLSSKVYRWSWGNPSISKM